MRNEKVVASGHGITVSISLAEPVLFLEGFDRNDTDFRKATILRGSLHLKLTKSAKIKRIYLKFKGVAQTHWPEGIPPKKLQSHETQSIMNHTWSFFNAQFPDAENSYCADHIQLAKAPVVTMKQLYSPHTTEATVDLFARSSSPANVYSMPSEVSQLSLQHVQSRSFGKGETANGGPTVAQRGYKLFHPGDYMYNFELPIDSRLPESIDLAVAFVRYELEAMVERSGAFRPNLLGTKEVRLIRTPAEGSLEHVEPIAISRTWEDQLHYDVIISGKSFPLGAQVPIAFKFTPLAKVVCHRIRVYVTENIQQWAKNRTAHRLDGSKKLLLFEKRADAPTFSAFPGSSMRVTAGGGIDWVHREAAARGEEFVNPQQSNLLGDLQSGFGVGPTEMEFNVQLPSCALMSSRSLSQRLHFDTTYENIEINHWIKVVLRLSKADKTDPTKRRHFEISIDSPFHIMSCLATQSNIYLPAYSSPSPLQTQTEEYECRCPGATPVNQASSGLYSIVSVDPTDDPTDTSTVRASRSFTSGSGGLSRPPLAHLSDEPNERSARPMHLLRVPSFAPPSFDDLPPPPPLVTPPPDYGSIVQTDDPLDGLDDYFDRLHLAEREYDENVRGSGRVDVPLTPGGRINRSMDIPRDWITVGENSGVR